MFKVKCVVCGKITVGRLPRAGRHDVGDTTFWFPRRHKVNGVDCDGNIQEGEIIDDVPQQTLPGQDAAGHSWLVGSSRR